MSPNRLQDLQRRKVFCPSQHRCGQKISKDEFDAAMKESATMTFVGWQASDDDGDDDEADVQNWYIDQLFRDLQKDIAEYYNISETAASSKLYTEALRLMQLLRATLQQI